MQKEKRKKERKNSPSQTALSCCMRKHAQTFTQDSC